MLRRDGINDAEPNAHPTLGSGHTRRVAWYRSWYARHWAIIQKSPNPIHHPVPLIGWTNVVSPGAATLTTISLPTTIGCYAAAISSAIWGY